MRILCCPRCCDEHVASNELIPALALGRWVQDANAEPRFAGNGNTDVWWGAQAQIRGWEAYCRNCDWSGPATDLICDPQPAAQPGAESPGG